ncbi:MAG: DUF6174 domain-containing protein [Ignavibacteria bacterium]|nr:DUF6174 domain-containing protein [Ignavibacteria bacterium]
MVAIVGFGVESAIRVAGRYDDGNYGARIIEGNGVKLLWVPEGLDSVQWVCQRAAEENPGRISCASLVVEYDTMFGFPKHIYVDPNAHIADEEYGYLTTSVRKLLK